MADVLLVCIREEDRDDFAIEFIKGLMSRGLTVSYAGAFYRERLDEYVYDDVTNLLFFASTYFREAQMKSKNFKKWEGFLDSIDFEQIDARLIIYVSTRGIEVGALENKFRDYLKNSLRGLIVELIRKSFEMSFFDFKSHYPEIVEILGIDWGVLRRLRNLIGFEENRLEDEFEIRAVVQFIEKCIQLRKEIIKVNSTEENQDILHELSKLENELDGLEDKIKLIEKNKMNMKTILQKREDTQRVCTELENILMLEKPTEEVFKEIESLQEILEGECTKYPSKGDVLFEAFFTPGLIDKIVENPERVMYFDISRRISRSETLFPLKKNILCLYYEETGKGQEKANLYFYPEKLYEKEIEKSSEEEVRKFVEKSVEEIKEISEGIREEIEKINRISREISKKIKRAKKILEISEEKERKFEEKIKEIEDETQEIKEKIREILEKTKDREEHISVLEKEVKKLLNETRKSEKDIIEFERKTKKLLEVTVKLLEESAKELSEEAKESSEKEAKRLQESAKELSEEAKELSEDAYLFDWKTAAEGHELHTSPEIGHELYIPFIPRSSLPLEKTRDLYSPENIRKIVDEHVMLALHPPLINIHFPVNDFMLEVDPEEPEIGFLSTRVNLSDSQNMEEELRVKSNLRKKLHIYKWKESKEGLRRGKFVEIKPSDNKENQEENIVIFGRIEHLFRVLTAKNQHGRIYHQSHTILELIVIMLLINLIRNIFRTPSPNDHLSVFLRVTVILFSAIFIFWASRTFVLNYLLEPMYDTLKLASYALLLSILNVSVKSRDILIVIFSFVILASVIIIFGEYIYSAILYSLSKSSKIIDYYDNLKTENLITKNSEESVTILRCGQFRTVAKANNRTFVFPNSVIFPKIKYICKKIRTAPRIIAYSSGILLSSENEKQSTTNTEKFEREVIYRKKRTLRFWWTIKSPISGKGRIECIKGLQDKFSPNNRFLYFGEWNYVMKHIGFAIPVFPESILFRNMLLLAVLSGLAFNVFPKIDFVGRIINVAPWNFVFLLAIPFALILITAKLKTRFWEVLLTLGFYFLLLFQLLSMSKTLSIILLFSFVLLAIVISFRLLFLIKQAWYSLRIWLYELRNGNIISVKSKNGNGERGTRIQRNILMVRLFISGGDSVEEERIYFNKQFFNDIIGNNEWIKIRENQA